MMQHSIGTRLTFDPADDRRAGIKRGAVVVKAHGNGWYLVEHVESGKRFTACDDELVQLRAPQPSEARGG